MTNSRRPHFKRFDSGKPGPRDGKEPRHDGAPKAQGRNERDAGGRGAGSAPKTQGRPQHEPSSGRGGGPSRGQGRPQRDPGGRGGGRSGGAGGSKGGAQREVFMEGQLQVKGRFGFVLSEDPGLPDAFIGPGTLKLAMGGDRVLARVWAGREGKREGEIVKVLKRARNTMVGVFHRTERGEEVRPEGDVAPLKIVDRGGFSVKNGDAVVVRVTQWPTLERSGEGAVTEVVGRPDDPAVQMKLLVKKYELSETFPPEVMREAQAYGTEVPESALEGRETFFHLPVCTIDGADAKDFDDAVSLEALPDGNWRLGVHIADVSHYVREGSALDEEAFARATSVYMPGKVVPMLPPALSDDLCSLRPKRVRLTLSCVMDVAPDGRLISARTCNSAIRSARRFTYEEVEGVLNGGKASDATPELVRDVLAMGKLARLLRARRMKRGALDMDFPEAKIVLDVRGRPVEVVKKERLESHRLIEDFMLLANEAVAALMKDRPFLYRVHERPSKDKLTTLAKTLRAYQVPVPPGFEDGQSHALQKVLKSVEGREIAPVIHMMCLRSLMKAVYSPLNQGHFGLAATFYTHFTSPIRRYPDLAVHRMVKEALARKDTRERLAHWKMSLPEVCARSSARERLATEMERESLQLHRVQLMKERVGDVFTATITGVSPFGFFVQPEEIFVEGLVPVADLDDDYYFYDEVKATLRGRRRGKTFGMGDKVTVRLAAANDVKRQLDFQLTQDRPAEKPKKKGWFGWMRK